jgi:beta-lactamase class A
MNGFAITRRVAVAGATSLLGLPARAADARQVISALRALESRNGARIGVAAVDTGTGRAAFWREAERFVMCSTFKLSLAGAVLARAAKDALSLDERVHYAKPVLGFSPATTRNQARGMTIAELCEAAIIYSDNTAANLLLDKIGGPAGVTAFWRSLGDRTSRLDDIEPKLNVPDGDRNTTTPAAMMADLRMMLLGDILAQPSRARLLAWMHANTTGGTSLKAGLPPDWRIGDKTGSGADVTGIVNDIGLITPPGRKPILASVYSEKSGYPVLADVGRILATAFV